MIFNINNNISEDYTYVLDTNEMFYSKEDIPSDIFTYNNNEWSNISTSNQIFNASYNDIKQAILNNGSLPQLIDYNDNFTSLLESDANENITKTLTIRDTSRESTFNYIVIIALHGVIDNVTLEEVTVNTGYTNEDYYQRSVGEENQVIFSDIEQGNYDIYIKTSGDNAQVYSSSQSVLFDNNLKAILTISNGNISVKTRSISPIYIGIKTQSQTGFPDIPMSQYFAVVLTNNLKACIPIKSLSFSNTKIIDISSYTPSDKEYLSAKQTLNFIKSELEKLELFQPIESLNALNALQHPQTSKIYFVQKTNDASDGLNISFDLYRYNPDYTSNNDKFIQLDNLAFDIRDFAPKSHASTSATYGLGTSSNYGHVKIIDNLNQNSNQDGLALSAHQGQVLDTNKQDTLISGTNIKTINNQSLLGSGNLSVITDISGKQDTLISGTNIKTINNESLLGSGNLTISSGSNTQIVRKTITISNMEAHGLSKEDAHDVYTYLNTYDNSFTPSLDSIYSIEFYDSINDEYEYKGYVYGTNAGANSFRDLGVSEDIIDDKIANAIGNIQNYIYQ